VGGGAQVVVRDAEVAWVGGVARTSGANNWILTAGTAVPAAWTGTLRGSDPGLLDVASGDLRPVQGSPLVDQAAVAAAGPAGFELPRPLPAPLYMPARAALPVGGGLPRPSVGRADIGALEYGSGPPVLPPDGGTPAGDAGAGGPGGGDEGGCGCRAGGGAGGGAAWTAVGLALLAALAAARARARA